MSLPVNFSSILPIANNVYSFNPSIAHWKDNLYLCSYREFVRYRHLFQRSKPNQSPDYNYTINTSTNPNHPWLGNIDQICVRKIIDGFDDTKMCIIKIYIETSEILLQLIESTMYDQNGVLENIDGVDARLLRIGTDKFLLSYNTSIQQDGATVPCVLISTRIIDVRYDTKKDEYQILIYPETILCQGVSHCDQKNWSFSLLSNRNIAFSYGLYPQHVMYLVVPFAPDKNIVALSCDSRQTLQGNQDNIFSKLVNYYGETIFSVSTSTPTVEIETNIFLGVGHIKFDYSKHINFYSKDSELFKLVTKMTTDKNVTHQKYMYLMFFYQINMTDGNITRCSNMFIPPSGGSYCFPSGLTVNNTDIILSYGENDEKCMFITFTTEQVDNLLKDNIVNKQANEVLFYIMPEEQDIDMMD